jgi:hypothetical protein
LNKKNMQETHSMTQPKKKISTIRLILTVTMRILGVRNSKISENDVGQLTGMQVGYACILALLGFTAIIGLLSMLVVKAMS